MARLTKHPRRPRVWLVGDVEHADFAEATTLLAAEAEMVSDGDVRVSPELVVIAQSRPKQMSDRRLAALRRAAPLAGFVALLGSWCEGHGRAVKPRLNVHPIYWHRFKWWWKCELERLARGSCPAWARPGENWASDYSVASRGMRSAVRGGLVVLGTSYYETAQALSDVLQRAGYATVWQPPGRASAVVRGARAAIWDGGQLDDREAHKLSEFCGQWSGDVAVIVLLDFPRRDGCELARAFGATTVLGKPWANDELLAAIGSAAQKWGEAGAA